MRGRQSIWYLMREYKIVCRRLQTGPSDVLIQATHILRVIESYLWDVFDFGLRDQIEHRAYVALKSALQLVCRVAWQVAQQHTLCNYQKAKVRRVYVLFQWNRACTYWSRAIDVSTNSLISMHEYMYYMTKVMWFICVPNLWWNNTILQWSDGESYKAFMLERLVVGHS